MGDKTEQLKEKFEDFVAKLKSLDVEVKDWNFSVGGNLEGTKIKVAVEVLVKAKPK